MKKLLHALLLPLALCSTASASEYLRTADFGQKSPLTIEFIIDTELQKEMTLEEIKKTIFQLTGIANGEFYLQLNRYLSIAKITYNEKLPEEINKSLVLDEKVVHWLLARPKNTDFVIFITQRPLTHKESRITVGIGSSGGGAAIISLNSDLVISANILMHEIGHNCGAQHADDPKSLMHITSSKSLSYDKENLKIIRENCG